MPRLITNPRVIYQIDVEPLYELIATDYPALLADLDPAEWVDLAIRELWDLPPDPCRTPSWFIWHGNTIDYRYGVYAEFRQRVGQFLWNWLRQPLGFFQLVEKSSLVPAVAFVPAVPFPQPQLTFSSVEASDA